MMKLFKTTLYGVILCSPIFMWLNNEQEQDFSAKDNVFISTVDHSPPSYKKPELPVEEAVKPLAKMPASPSVVEAYPRQVPRKSAKVAVKPQVNSCAKVTSKHVAHKREIYEWIDGKGRRQLSDIPPKRDYKNLKVKGLYIDDYFNLKLDSRHADLPAFTQSDIQSGVTKIYKTLVQVIKVSELRAINLNLRFYSDKDQFHRYRQDVAPETGFKATGFYTSRLNEATIFAVGSKAHMTSISLHESTHAIVAAMFGGAPVWLNEGLASFFDQMIITGEQTFKFSMDDRRMKLLRSSSIPALGSHFSQTPKQWYAYTNDDLNYAVDWSLVFFMMINPSRRDFLRAMLEHLAVNDCHRFSTTSYINQHYPGGLKQLESTWLHWLKNAPAGTVTF